MVLLTALSVGQLRAEDYPTHTVKIVVPGAPGGGLDRAARLISEKLRRQWGQPVIVENHPGAAGIVGTEFVAKAAPDGYTLLYAATAHLVINDKTLYPKIAYDPSKFTPISLVTTAPNVLVVNAKLPVKSVKELIALAKSEPGKLSYASPGVGTTQQLSVEVIKSRSGLDIQHIPYNGGGPAIVALLADQVDIMFTEISGLLPNIRSGALRPLAVGSEKPNPLLPGVPPISETYPGFVSMTWQALVAPPGTSPAIAAKIAVAVAQAIKQPDIAKTFSHESLETVGSTPAELAAFLQREHKQWGGIVRQLGLKKD